MENLKKALRDLKQGTDSELKKAVITDILSQGDNDDIICYIKDVLTHDYINTSVISSFIYYKDTDTFFKKHHEEILKILDDNKLKFTKEFNSYNLSKFAYFIIIKKIANTLKIEY